MTRWAPLKGLKDYFAPNGPHVNVPSKGHRFFRCLKTEICYFIMFTLPEAIIRVFSRLLFLISKHAVLHPTQLTGWLYGVLKFKKRADRAFLAKLKAPFDIFLFRSNFYLNFSHG